MPVTETNPPQRSITLRFHYHRLRHELTNFSLLKSRHVDGQIISQHQSGTHWLKYMMANALSHQHDLPPPKYNHANDYIGGPKDPTIYPNIPHIISSHSIPPVIAPWLIGSQIIKPPKYILLVRDIRASLVSNYRKWQDRYDQSFSKFLRGDPAGRKYNSDLWWSIRFLNAWTRVWRVDNDNILTIHYESLLENPIGQLTRIRRHLDLDLTDGALSVGVENASKAAMKSRADPQRPEGEVNESSVDILDWFDASDRLFFSTQCAKFLICNYNYDYDRWE